MTTKHAGRLQVAASGEHPSVHLGGQLLDAFRQLLRRLREPGILIEERLQILRFLRREFLPLETGPRKIFAVARVGVGVRLVPIRLTGLREEDQRRRIGGLEAERQVEDG